MTILPFSFSVHAGRTERQRWAAFQTHALRLPSRGAGRTFRVVQSYTGEHP